MAFLEVGPGPWGSGVWRTGGLQRPRKRAPGAVGKSEGTGEQSRILETRGSAEPGWDGAAELMRKEREAALGSGRRAPRGVVGKGSVGPEPEAACREGVGAGEVEAESVPSLQTGGGGGRAEHAGVGDGGV